MSTKGVSKIVSSSVFFLKKCILKALGAAPAGAGLYSLPLQLWAVLVFCMMSMILKQISSISKIKDSALV